MTKIHGFGTRGKNKNIDVEEIGIEGRIKLDKAKGIEEGFLELPTLLAITHLDVEYRSDVDLADHVQMLAEQDAEEIDVYSHEDHDGFTRVEFVFKNGVKAKIAAKRFCAAGYCGHYRERRFFSRVLLHQKEILFEPNFEEQQPYVSQYIWRICA